MNKLQTLKKWYLPFILFNLFIVIAVLVSCITWVTTLDLKVITCLQHILSSIDAKIWSSLSTLHHNCWAPVVVLTTIFLVYKKDYKLAILYFICDFNANKIITFIKEIIQRHRPPVELQPLEHPTTYSFPSGHSYNIMIFLGFLIIIILKYVENKVLKYTLSSICGILIILVGLSRNMLGVHYPTDVIGGFLLGLTLLSVVWIIDKSE